jgi:hypothetical protein
MKLIARKFITLDEDKAKQFLAINTYPAQRPKSEKQITNIINAIIEDRFVDGDIALATLMYNGGQTVLVNGQHQSNAVLRCKIPVTVAYKHYQVDSPEDLAFLYRQFDQHKDRSLSDVARPEAHALGINWSSRIVNLLIGAAALKDRKRDQGKQEKVLLLRKYLKAGEALLDILVGVEGKHLRRATVVAAMLMAWEKNQEQTIKFWTDVRNGENLKKTMPAYKLREYLLSVNLSMRGVQNAKRSVPEREVLVRAIAAWNAFRKGESTALKYFADKPIPRAI